MQNAKYKENIYSFLSDVWSTCVDSLDPAFGRVEMRIFAHFWEVGFG